MTVNGVSTDTTGRLPWAGVQVFPVGAVDPDVMEAAMTCAGPLIGEAQIARLRRVK